MMHGYLWIKSGHILIVPCEDIDNSLVSTINASFSVSDKLSHIKMGLGWSWLPKLIRITLSSVGGSCCSNHFSHLKSNCWAYGSTSVASTGSNWLLEVILTVKFSNIVPTMTSDSHLEEEAERDGIGLLSLDWIVVGGGGVMYPNTLHVLL